MKKQGAVAPLSHRLDTSSRVEQPKQDRGCESAAHARQLEASGQEKVDSMRMKVSTEKGRRHTRYSNDLLRHLTAGAHTEVLRRLCTNTGAFAPLGHDNDTSLRARERVQGKGHDLQGKG